MKRRTLELASTFTCLALLAGAPCAGADWPQWRGPARDGRSAETGLQKEWPKEGPKLVWQVKDLGYGFSTPAVAGDRLYVLSNAGEEESIKCLEAAGGKEVWSRRIGNVGNPKQKPSYPGARSTPTIDGDAIYVLGSDGDLACLDRAAGKPRWEKSLRKDFGGEPGTWAYAESPLIDGDVLVATPGGSQATIVALRKGSGEVIWKSQVPGGDKAGYASAIPIEAGGLKQYVQFLGKGLVGVEAKTGKFLWRYDATAQGSPANIPTPVARDGLVYSGTGRGGAGLVKLKVDGGSVAAEQVYASPKLPTAIGGAVLVGEHLYGATGEALVCADFKSGQIRWAERSIAPASLCFAEGRLYLHGEGGEMALVEATPEAYREKGRFSPPGQPDRKSAKAWAYPAVANGRLYIRDLDLLWCYDVKGEGTTPAGAR